MGGLVILRADSAYYTHDVIAAGRRAGARFSVTACKDRAVTAAIAGIGQTGWTTICYPQAVFDEQLGQWISDAEVAETPLGAFTSRRQSEHVGGRLIVRRVRDAQGDRPGQNRPIRPPSDPAPPGRLDLGHRLETTLRSRHRTTLTA